MAEPLKILIVDPQPDAVANLRRSLNSFGTFEVVGDAGFGPVASTWAHTLEPAIVIVAVDEPLTRALTTIQALARGNPPWTVVGLVNQFDREVFRRTVLAGARDVLLRHSSPNDLHDSLVQAHNADRLRVVSTGQDPGAPTGSIMSVFGVKGGVGKTTLATNLAVALAQEGSASVALVDMDVPFGDVALMLDMHPEQDILDALSGGTADDLERLQKLLVRSPHGVHVLAAPLAPDEAGSIDSRKIGGLLTKLAALHQFVLVDTPVGLTELTAAALDVSELALLVTTPEVAALRRTHACLRVLQGLEFPMNKLQLVLNRVESRTQVSSAEAVEALGQPVAWRVANDYAAMQSSALGTPVVLASPKTRLSRDIVGIARQLTGAPAASRGSWLPWRRRAALALA
ncbi:MAG: P-loop NTPase [Chloroflexi bacterium]|nr:P-loop NTPase [Chloroflexota bacterium]